MSTPTHSWHLAHPGPGLAGEIAASLGASPALYPYFATLFGACRGLGTSPQAAANWLKHAGVNLHSRVIDLGCGLGATSRAVARLCSADVVGVDACPEFIAMAAERSLHEKTNRATPAGSCEFMLANFNRLSAIARTQRGVALREPFDAAILLSILPSEKAIRLARRWVRPGGVYLFDDAVAIDGHGDGHAPTLEQVNSTITRTGDTIVRIEVLAPARTASLHRATQLRLESGVAALRRAALPKSISRRLTTFLDLHRRSLSRLTGPVRPVYWLAKRATSTRSNN